MSQTTKEELEYQLKQAKSIADNYSVLSDRATTLAKSLSEKLFDMKVMLEAKEEYCKYLGAALAQKDEELKSMTALHVEVSGRNVTLHCENLELKREVREYMDDRDKWLAKAVRLEEKNKGDA